MASKVIHAIYNDDDILLQAVKDTRENKYRIEEVYIPFHVHGLEDAMGMAYSISNNLFYLWYVRICCCGSNGKLYDDCGLATRYWR